MVAHCSLDLITSPELSPRKPLNPQSVESRSITLLLSLAFVIFLFCGATAAHAQTATVQLSWTLPTDTTGITEYRIYVRPAGGSYSSTYTQVIGATTTTKTLTNLTAGSYFFIAKSYNGTAESDPSNEVAITAAVAVLEERNAAQTSGRTFHVQVYNVGQSSSPLVEVNCTANTSGMITIPTGTSGLPATFDLRIKSAGYLAKRAASRTLAATNNLPTLLAGDLSTDPNLAIINTINTFDYGVVKANWFGADATSDFNGDGIVNGLDYNLVKKNWFQSDDI